MADRTQKLSMRLLREGLEPNAALRPGALIDDWPSIEGSKILCETIGGYPPKWAAFLNLSAELKEDLENTSAIGLVFIKAEERWFVFSFGLGHVKLDPAQFEHDFGLKVVLNSVDPNQIRSADVRTPDENTLSRRSQTSRGSDQAAFAFDIERDIVRGLAGRPKDTKFATRVAGADALTLHRKVELSDLPSVCSDTFAMYNKTEYLEHFRWVDQIKHVRDEDILTALRSSLLDKINNALKIGVSDDITLAFPVIYDPEKGDRIQYKGFRSAFTFSDLDIEGYFESLIERKLDSLSDEDLNRHSVHEVDEEGKDIGDKWSVYECIATELEHDGCTYVISSGRWYRIDKDLALQVQSFFADATKITLPDAKAGENEETYNKRLKKETDFLLCLDRELITPSGWTTTMEACDFLSKNKEIIHVKDKTSSSRLSHLFSQGTVSGRVLVLDALARDKLRIKIEDVQKETKQNGFLDIIPGSGSAFSAQDYTVVYAVIAAVHAKLPFFSLLTFRQAALNLYASGYKYAFSWIIKPADPGEKKKPRAAKSSS